MHTEYNSQGQLLISLSENEWRDYGRQAGYTMEMIKEASEETNIIEENIEVNTEQPVEANAEEEVTIATLQKRIESLSNELNEIKSAKTEEKMEKGTDFNEENYPNLLAEQQKDGLIGVFAPRP